jgi:hypothetical protein
MKLTQEGALEVHNQMLATASDVLLRKRQDYSGKEDPFRNFRKSAMFGVEPWRGVLVRITDKLSRLESIAETGKRLVDDESLFDTAGDVVNYTGILLGLIVEHLEWKASFRGRVSTLWSRIVGWVRRLFKR